MAQSNGAQTLKVACDMFFLWCGRINFQCMECIISSADHVSCTFLGNFGRINILRIISSRDQR